MQRHLLRSTATDALDSLLSWSQLEFGEDDISAAAGEPAVADPASSSSWTPAARSKLVKSLPAEIGQPLAKALEAAGGTDPQVRLGHVVAGAEALANLLRKSHSTVLCLAAVAVRGH